MIFIAINQAKNNEQMSYQGTEGTVLVFEAINEVKEQIKLTKSQKIPVSNFMTLNQVKEQ